MSEWLTTGQMISKIKVEEIAEGVWESTDGKLGCNLKIKREENGLKNLSNHDGVLHFDNMVFKAKWRILPKYVSFDEALKALREGKTIKYNFSETDDNQNLYVSRGHMKEISSVWILSDRWTIEG